MLSSDMRVGIKQVHCATAERTETGGTKLLGFHYQNCSQAAQSCHLAPPRLKARH